MSGGGRRMSGGCLNFAVKSRGFAVKSAAVAEV